MDPPVLCDFDKGKGIFNANDLFNGKPIRLRICCTGTHTSTLNSEQAFSPDAGETWEINWTMTFVRLFEVR